MSSCMIFTLNKFFIFLSNFGEGIMIADEHKIAYQKHFTFKLLLEFNLGDKGDIKHFYFGQWKKLH